MNKLFFIIFILIIFVHNFSIAQDTLLKEPILSKDFNLTTEYLEFIINKSGISETKLKNSEYEDCSIVIPVNDSVFKIKHVNGNSSILYNNIKEISFKDGSKFGKGLWQGAVIGLCVGLVFDIIIIASPQKKASNPPKEFDGFGEGLSRAFLSILIPPLTTFIGALIGGISGAGSYDYIKYDLSKYSQQEKRKKALELFNKYKGD